MTSSELRRVQVTRYVTPLREGGSLPAIVEADDGFLYVLKFKGAGQGTRALIAELIGGELARAAGLKVPELVFADLDAAFGRTEGDEEIQDLLRASEGLNLGLHYLSGAITFDPAVDRTNGELASKIVWLDAFLGNVDRTFKNTNMLTWHNELWLIDHGAALYYHHSGEGWEKQFDKSFVQIKDHVLLARATDMQIADKQMRSLITGEIIQSVVNLIPEVWLSADGEDPNLIRSAYSDFLIKRLSVSDIFVKEIEHARETLV